MRSIYRGHRKNSFGMRFQVHGRAPSLLCHHVVCDQMPKIYPIRGTTEIKRQFIYEHIMVQHNICFTSHHCIIHYRHYNSSLCLTLQHAYIPSISCLCHIALLHNELQTWPYITSFHTIKQYIQTAHYIALYCIVALHCMRVNVCHRITIAPVYIATHPHVVLQHSITTSKSILVVSNAVDRVMHNHPIGSKHRFQIVLGLAQKVQLTRAGDLVIQGTRTHTHTHIYTIRAHTHTHSCLPSTATL